MSKVAEEKRNWLEEVKADAEALTRARLQADLPKMEQEVAARESKKKEARRAGVEFADVPPTQAVVSDGQPDQGAIGSLTGEKSETESEELKELKAQLKAERAARTRAENKLKKNSEESEAQEDVQPDEEDVLTDNSEKESK